MVIIMMIRIGKNVFNTEWVYQKGVKSALYSQRTISCSKTTPKSSYRKTENLLVKVKAAQSEVELQEFLKENIWSEEKYTE